MPTKKEKQPLSVSHPELAKEADGWDPSTISMGSVKHLNWKCKNLHNWTSTPNSRTNQQSGCPYCSGKYLLTGFNDLATTHPDIAKQADGWDPKTLGRSSHAKVSWICDGHTYLAKVSDRVSGTGCPYCSGRKVLIGLNDLGTTHPELAKELLDANPTQYSKGSGAKLKWKCKKNHIYDAAVSARTGRNRSCPICAGKIPDAHINDLVTTHPELAKQASGWDPTQFKAGSSRKMAWKCSSGHSWDAVISNRSLNNAGCPVCSRHVVKARFNDLKTTHPQIAAEAFGWDPTTVLSGSEKKMDWMCEKSHVYKASVQSRKGGTGCPICSGAKVLKGFNDLATTFPELAKQADGWDPTTVSKGSHSKKSWRCQKGHTWTAIITSRNRIGIGCPICNNKQLLVGFNDLATTHPDIAKQADGWDPSTVTFGSAKKRSWVCEKGHKWDTSVSDRRESGCAVCSGRKVLEGLNDLATTHPVIASEAVDWDPKKYSAGSGRRVKWKCKLGHTWNAIIAGRVAKNNGCPYCQGTRVWVGFNDLLTTRPDIAREAYEWDTSKYSEGSGKKLPWKCSEGHIWETRIISRTKGSGCPTCSSTQYDPNDVGYLYFLENLKWEMLQIGITNQPEKRLAKHARGGWEVIEIQQMDGLLARNWETSILQMLRGSGVVLGPLDIAGKFDGYSEAWSKSTFEVKSIKELMELTEKFENE